MDILINKHFLAANSEHVAQSNVPLADHGNAFNALAEYDNVSLGQGDFPMDENSQHKFGNTQGDDTLESELSDEELGSAIADENPQEANIIVVDSVSSFYYLKY